MMMMMMMMTMMMTMMITMMMMPMISIKIVTRGKGGEGTIN